MSKQTREPDQQPRKTRKNVKGFSKDSRGYLICTLAPNVGNRMHRVVMEEYLGRKLQPNEHVHHINGDRSDNRIENLRVLTNAEHGSLHKRKGEDLVCAICGVIRHYPPAWVNRRASRGPYLCHKCYKNKPRKIDYLVCSTCGKKSRHLSLKQREDLTRPGKAAYRCMECHRHKRLPT